MVVFAKFYLVAMRQCLQLDGHAINVGKAVDVEIPKPEFSIYKNLPTSHVFKYGSSVAGTFA